MLRPVIKTDIATFFDQQLDPVSNWLVAFTHPDPTDETVTMRTIVVDNLVAGYVTKYEIDGKPQIDFVLDRRFWGKLGFIPTSEGLYFSNARGAEIVEVLWTLP